MFPAVRAFPGEPGKIPTRDLRFRRAPRGFTGVFRCVQNTCKWQHSDEGTFLSISGDLFGLLQGCCTEVTACTRTRSGMIAIGLEGRDSTKDPPCIACLRTQLPRVVLKEVDTTEARSKAAMNKKQFIERMGEHTDSPK